MDQFDQTDHYAVLGVDPSSPPEEITRAFRRLARQYHPDLNQNDADAARRFKHINGAYQVLADPEKRAQYDLQRARAPSSWSAEAAPTGPAGEEQPIIHQHTMQVEVGTPGELTSAVEQVAKQFASELQDALREFGAELGSLSETLRTEKRDIPGRWRFPPSPPPKGRPPRNGRPPRDGKAPKP